MSTTYKIIAGDTFESIARKSYGTNSETENLSRANPGVSEPLVVGTIINVPTQSEAPQNLQQQAAAANVDEVAVLIDGNRFRYWTNARLSLSTDKVDSLDLSAPFDSEAPGFKDTFRPFSYKEVVVTVGGVVKFTGKMVSIVPALSGEQKTIAVSAYSAPGVLSDCTAPASSYPLEFNNMGFEAIAIALTKPFGIGVRIASGVDLGAVFERVAMEPGQMVMDFLMGLAKQRNVVLSSTYLGKLLVRQSVKPGNPVAVLRQGDPAVLSVTPTFRPQEYYSHITGIDPAAIGSKGGQYTVKNPRLTGVLRPHTFKVKDSDTGTVKSAVEAKMGRMYGQVVSYVLRVPTWRDPSGNLWQGNTTLKLQANDAMIYSLYEFEIRDAVLETDNASQTASLTLILPGAFSGKIPETLPWD